MYQVIINDSIGRRLSKLPESDHKKIKKVLLALQEDPLPQGKDLKKMASQNFPLWRIRIGDLRIVYFLLSDKKVVQVVNIDFRGNIY